MLVKDLLMDQEIDEVQFFGKLFPKVYELLEKTLINTASIKLLCVGIHFTPTYLWLPLEAGKQF